MHPAEDKKETIDLLQLAKAHFKCVCGRRHKTDIREIIIAEDLLRPLESLARQQGICQAAGPADSPAILMVADDLTWQAAGKKISSALHASGLPVAVCCFPADPPLVPDERAVFTLLEKMRPPTRLLLAVGTGTINDLTRFVSHRTGTPYVVVATAPSMDGYASSVAALVVNNMKLTMTAWGAKAILAAPSVLAASPPVMIAAGLGDILGKYTALCDWRLAGIVENEYQCDYVAGLVMQAVNDCRRQAGSLAIQDEAAVSDVFRALILTGLVISYVGSSRPASGSEHHLSHFWEMAFIRTGRPPVLHGSKVGLATLMTCLLYRHLIDLQPDFRRARRIALQYQENDWVRKMQQIYGSGADEIIRLEKRTGRHDAEKACARISQIEKCWPAILALVRQTIPEPADIRPILLQSGGITEPAELGISRELVADSLRHAMEMRPIYTLLRLYSDLGETETAIRLIDRSFLF